MKILFALLCLLFCAGLGFSQVQAQSPASQQSEQSLETLRGQMLRRPSSQAESKSPSQTVKQITSNPLYRETSQTTESENWLDRSMKNFNDWLNGLFNQQSEQPNQRSGSLFQAAGILIQIVIYALLAAIVGFLIFMVTKIRLNRKKGESNSDGLMSESEALRNSDEWLKEADRLSESGDFRGAIRCLYLACLTQLDQSGILRFERFETNWEHLYRFSESQNRLISFSLKEPTQKFDAAWYGHVTQTQNDVDWFKNSYLSLKQEIREQKR